MSSTLNRRPLLAYRRAALLLAALVLGGCGGGFDDLFGNSRGRAPTIALAVAPNPVQRGQTLQLVAAATGDPAIDEVAFFSVGLDGALVRLGSVGTAPFVWTQVVASTATGPLRYQARVTDSRGKTADSLVVEVLITLPLPLP